MNFIYLAHSNSCSLKIVQILFQGKNSGSKAKRKSSVEKSNNLNDEDDDALQQVDS